MIRKLILTLASLIVFCGAAVAFVVLQNLSALDEPVGLDGPVSLEVDRGTAFVHVAREFEDRGWVDDAFWLRVKARLFPELAGIQSGYYRFEPGISVTQMLQALADGRTHTWPIRFGEGWTFARIREELAEQEHLEQTIADLSGEAIMERLGQPDTHPEGWFYPDTYRYHKGQTDLSVLRQAYERMNRVLAQEWADREPDLPYSSPYEALIMASIIERETGVPHERRRIAGVFVRRLEKGMRLQTDPTVIYGMGERYEGRITRSDLREHTPYNTYRIDGLPPTPIAMPMQASIHAAVNPAEGDALYFVARGDGSHRFSRTLEEHNEAVREYQLQRREDYRSFPSPTQSRSDNGE